MKRVIFTVTNDCNYDQRMMRICTSLAQAGYSITLVGTKNSRSLPLQPRPYRQKRISPIFNRGFGFYAVYNTRLFFYLLFAKCDAICSIDLDTIVPVWLAAELRGKKRIFDAHEYFSQQKEVISRPRVYKVWHWIERQLVPRFPKGYTVSQSIADEFKKLYEVHYELIRNIPSLKIKAGSSPTKERVILYQGAVNEARGLEYLIPAMKEIDASLVIYGDGNFMEQTKNLISVNNLETKVLLKGKLLPEELDEVTPTAHIGINLVENIGLNQYYSLANKFFDYMHYGIPQVSMNFPEYKKINDEFEVAILLDDLKEGTIAAALNRLLNDGQLYERLQQNCLKVREVLNWQEEEKKLLAFYEKIF